MKNVKNNWSIIFLFVVFVFLVLFFVKSRKPQQVLPEPQQAIAIPLLEENNEKQNGYGKYISRIGEDMAGKDEEGSISFEHQKNIQSDLVTVLNKNQISIGQFDAMIDQVLPKISTGDFSYSARYALSSYVRTDGIHYVIHIPTRTGSYVALFNKDKKFIKGSFREAVGIAEQFAAGGGTIEVIDLNNDNIDDVVFVPDGHNCCGENGFYISLDESHDLPQEVSVYNTHASAGVTASMRYEGTHYVNIYISYDESGNPVINYSEKELDLKTYTLHELSKDQLEKNKNLFLKELGY